MVRQPYYPGVVQSWIAETVAKINVRARLAVEKNVEEGETLVKRYISTRGTQLSGKAGRIETGRMLNSVSGEILLSTPTDVIGRFGYRNTPSYTVYQEYGTRSIVPMYALVDASEQTKIQFEIDMRGLLRGL